MAKERRITQCLLADGELYAFAEVPTSSALTSRLAEALEGKLSNDAGTVKALQQCFLASLKLAGHSRDAAEEITWLIDFEDGEVMRPLMAAVFPSALRSGGAEVAPSDGGLRPGVGEDSA